MSEPPRRTSPGKPARRREGADRSRRSPEAHRAILAASWELLGTVGYHDLTIEGVAAQAKVGKATIYRWWSSKGALVGEAIATYLEVGPEPDTGTSRGDIRASIQSTIDNYSGTLAGVAIPALATDLVHDPELQKAFHDRFLLPRRRTSAAILERAITRGDLPTGSDIGLLQDIWAGTIFYRVLISREPVTEDLADRLVDLLLSGRVPREPDRGSSPLTPGSSHPLRPHPAPLPEAALT